MFISLCICSLLAVGQVADSSVEVRFQTLVEREWEHTLALNPTWASHLGDRRWNDRWDDLRLETLAREQQHNQKILAELAAIERSDLPTAEQLNYDLFRNQYERQTAAYTSGSHLLAMNHRDGIQLADDFATALRFETKQDYLDWIGRLRTFGESLDQTIELLREGMRRGIVQPRLIVGRIPAQVEKQLVAKAEESPFYRPFLKMPRSFTAAEKSSLQQEAQAAIGEVVIPAYRRLQKFLSDEYLPKCYPEVGAWQFPQGADFYAHCCRQHTTTNLSPDEIHEIGLAEVARIKSEMQRVKEDVGFQGTLPEFFVHLRSDPKYFCRNEEELLQTYQTVSKRIDPLLVKLFRTLPRMPYGVEAIPSSAAPDTTTAYYRQPAADGSRAGTYFVNLYRPETRPKWEMMALSMHEAVPGHHLQIALAGENLDLPQFRRHGHYTAYIEGWALYAESLGDELGLYADPLDKFGQLTYEMWRAVRLVVDTGMHHRRWSRDRAISYFSEHAPKMENDIVNEIDRYISWPGQALAYKVGELEMKKLRRESEQKLGERFDIKEFHDVVLLGGAMPLSVLRTRVETWQQEVLARKAK